MVSISFWLVLVPFTSFLIKPTACTSPTYLQNHGFDDITSIRREFPFIISKIKVMVNRLQCPEGWRYFGGSCYYSSNLTSTPSGANQTCTLLHSDRSNLIQIRHSLEFFYAVHVLTRNNLPALILDIDPNLIKEKRKAELLIKNQGQWRQMREKFRRENERYYKLKQEILNELNSTGLRILKRSKPIKPFDEKDQFLPDYQYKSYNLITKDGNDHFERLENLRGLCDQLDWNDLNNNSTLYILTTSLVSNKVVCSLKNVEVDLKYAYLCEYVLDYCFANTVCGKHGHCLNTLAGFTCSCSFVYDGLRCEKISKQGIAIIIAFVLVLVLYGLSISVVIARRIVQKRNKRNNLEGNAQELVPIKKTDENSEEQTLDSVNQHSPTILKRTRKLISSSNPHKRDRIRLFSVGGLSILFFILFISITIITYLTSVKYYITDATKSDPLINQTSQLVAKCGRISNYHMKNLIFSPIAVVLILVFSWSVRREKLCLHQCDGRPGLLSPIEPFRTANRLSTATVFGIIAFEVLKSLEELFFSTGNSSDQGIFIELLTGIAIILLIGLRYYPVLVSLQVRNIAVRFFVCLYLFGDIIYTMIREGSCVGLRYYSGSEAPTLRMELGTSFIIYDLIKNIPHFILLSYLAAELFVRFAYDSIYIPIKKKRSIWSAPVVATDESAFPKYYVTQLFRRSPRLNDYEVELQRKASSLRVKRFLNSIYPWDDTFRFTTIATCTYTVAIVFLYYLALTLLFLYLSRGKDFSPFLSDYIEMTFHIELQEYFSFRLMIIISAVITIVIFACHLCMAMKNYKRHKLQLFKGIYLDIPSVVNFKPNSIPSISIRYFGFFVGYMACGFFICFHLIFLIFLAIRILFLQIPYIEFILAKLLPLFVVYILIRAATAVMKFSFFRPMKDRLYVNNRKLYGIFVYWNFFLDCFLGIVSCIIRLIKAIFLNVFYLARLDSSLHTRSLEKLDFGLTTYLAYIHMEVAQTNPIMLAFCSLLYDGIVQRRPKRGNDECCAGPDDEMPAEQELKTVKSVSAETPDRNVNSSSLKKTKSRKRQTASLKEKKQNLIRTDDGNESLSIEKTESPSENPKQPIDNDIQDEKEEPQPRDTSNVSTGQSTVTHLVKPEDGHEFDRNFRQKRLRFRWFLAYTLLNNYSLLALRKGAQYRLFRLHTARSRFNDEQPYIPDASVQPIVVGMEIPESPKARQSIKPYTKSTTEPSESSEDRSAVQLLTPESDVGDYQQNAAEGYAASGSSMLHDDNTQQVDTPLPADENLHPSSSTSSSQYPHQVETINEQPTNSDQRQTNSESSSPQVDNNNQEK